MQPSTIPTPPQTNAPARCHVADHVRVWPDILPGLHALHEQDDAQDWDIDTVRKTLDDGRMLLVVDNDDPRAFVVIRIDIAPCDTTALELFVYLAWHQGGCAAIERFQPHLEAMARRAGATYMRFFSRRRGMLKLAPKAGYHARSVEYVKELR